MKQTVCLAFTLAFLYNFPAVAVETKPSYWELKVNGRYFGDEGHAVPTQANPNPKETRYEQSALGGELNFQSPYYDDVIGIDASLFGVAKLADSGNPSVQLLDVNPNGKVDDSFASVGILALKAKYGENEARIGRQKVDTLFIKSTTNRAVPDTFSGVTVKLKPFKNMETYAGYYNKWLPRTADSFTDFVTDNHEKIDYVALLGAKYKYHGVGMTVEYLDSDEYLKKYGVIFDYNVPLKASALTLRTGAMFSKDGGNLFKCGAETDLDCIRGQSIENNGNGYFIDSTWKKKNLELGAAITKVNGFWIEDNYSTKSAREKVLIQDNGTNPFPTASVIGPDFTNNDELAWMVRAKYDWKDYVKGLSTDIKYISGSGIHQSNIVSDVKGKERSTEVGVSYKIPAIKNLDFRYSYLTYHSDLERKDLSRKINGLLRDDWHQHRAALTYSYKF